MPRVVAARIQVDLYTAQVVRAMAARRLRPILLKGPAVARWLYADDPSSRPYSDADLLVCPAERDRAEAVLAQLGFQQLDRTWLVDEPPHATTWLRVTDGAIVDLHCTLHGCEHLADAAVWNVVSAGTGVIEVCGVEVEIPSLEVRTLHVALHAIAELGGPGSQAFVDLERALRQVDRQTWEQAAAVARLLAVDDEMGYRLSLLDEGRRLAHVLGLPTSAPLRIRDETRALVRLVHLPGWRAKSRYALQKLFPPPAYLSSTMGLPPERARLARTYVLRLAIILRRSCVAMLRRRRPPPSSG